MRPSASGSGLSDGAAPGVGYTTASQPATPTLAKNTPNASTTSVSIADAKPRAMSRCGVCASSAAFATPSMPR